MDAVEFALLTVIPELAIVYAQMTLLLMRKRGLYFVVCMLEWALSIFFRVVVPVRVLNVLLDLVLEEAVLPFVFYRARPAYRLVAIVLVVLLVALGKVALSTLWITLSGEPVMDYAAAGRHSALSVGLFLIYAAIVFLGARFSGFLLHRFLPQSLVAVDVRHGASRLSDMSTADGSRGEFLAMAVVIQMVFLVVLTFAPARKLAQVGEYYAGLVVLVAECLVVDVMLALAMRHYEEALIQEQRAAVLAARLDACLASYGVLVAGVERTAALRHDLRNHLQVIEALAERGEFACTERHLDEVLAELEKGHAARGDVWRRNAFHSRFEFLHWWQGTAKCDIGSAIWGDIVAQQSCLS